MPKTDVALPLPRFDGESPRVLLVAAPFYRVLTDGLIRGARAVLDAFGAGHDLIEVPGALEIAPAIRHAAGHYDGFVALGCVLRGETTHYEIVCNETARAITLLTVDRGLCVGNGVLTCENFAQAEARVDPNDMDKGGGAAAAALHLIAIARRYADPMAKRAPEGSIRMADAPLRGA